LFLQIFMTNDEKSLSQNLKFIRMSKGLSQQDLANKCGISKKAISHYETNISNPPIDKLKAISVALNVTIADLLNEKLLIKNNNLNVVDLRILKKIIKIKSIPVKEQNKIWLYIETVLKNFELEQKNNQTHGTK